jgi:hypothetical protein
LKRAKVLPKGMTVKDLEAVCRRLGMHRRTYYQRRDAGYTHAQALSVGSDRRVPLVDRVGPPACGTGYRERGMAEATRAPGADPAVVAAAMRAWR